MALSETLRNEIAYKYILSEAARRPLPSQEEAEGWIAKIMSNWPSSQVGDYVHDLMHAVFARQMPEHSFESRIQEDHRDEMSWELLLEAKFQEGIKIGEMNKRQVGNEAKKLGISTSVAWEFAQLVATEIFNRSFTSKN